MSLGYSPGGKRRRRTVRGRTKTEVRDKLRGLRDDIAVGVGTPAAYAVQQAVDDWLSSGLDGRSAVTVTKYRHVLKPVLELIGRASLRRAIRHAEARDLVRRNVAALTDSPKGQQGRPSKALSLEQAQALLREAADLDRHRLGAYVSICLQTGIRTEEARALTWEHVDLDGKPDADPPPSIAVWRSVRQHGDTKTRMSRRTLALPRATVEILREHRERQQQERIKAGAVWQDHDLVFCTGLGTPLDAANIRRQFRDLTARAGLGTHWAPQELRHTFVSLLSASGISAEQIAHLAGHSKPMRDPLPFLTSEGSGAGPTTTDYAHLDEHSRSPVRHPVRGGVRCAGRDDSCRVR